MPTMVKAAGPGRVRPAEDFRPAAQATSSTPAIAMQIHGIAADDTAARRENPADPSPTESMLRRGRLRTPRGLPPTFQLGGNTLIVASRLTAGAFSRARL